MKEDFRSLALFGLVIVVAYLIGQGILDIAKMIVQIFS